MGVFGVMLQDLDFSNLEMVSAVRNISKNDDYKSVLCTITFLDKKDSVSHLTGLERTFAELKLEEEKRYIKLAASYTSINDEIVKDQPIKVIFTDINNKYKKVSYFERDVDSTILSDVEFVNQVYERSPEEIKRLYL